MTALILACLCAAPAPDPTPTTPVTPAATIDAEFRFVDDSVLKCKLADEKIEVSTKYGLLQIPTSDIKRIEFGLRVPTDVALTVQKAIKDCGDADYKVREAAVATLKSHRERSYAACVKALKDSTDPEVQRRLEEVVKHLEAKIPASVLKAPESDTIQTADSKIVGRITAQTFRTKSLPFGNQEVKLTDLRQWGKGGIRGDQPSTPAPTNLSSFGNKFGEEHTFTVTGQAQQNGQNIWGGDTYTLDSPLALAAVHAGVVQPGETAEVTVRIVASPPQFVAVSRNGVNSTAYGQYPSGAYEFVRR